MPGCYHLLPLLFLLTASFHAPAQQRVDRDTSEGEASYYLSYMPAGEPKGLLLLLPGFGETPENAASETDIPASATKQSLICILASLPEGTQSFYIDPASQKYLDRLIEDLYSTYALAGKKLYLGGFSLGGSGVVKYAQRASQSKQLKKPHAIFAIDPPLDFERFYQSQEKALAANFNDIAVQEARYFLERIKREFGSAPADNLSSYHLHSPFSNSDNTKKGAKNLVRQPILLISEPAREWQKKERGRAYGDLNANDCELLIQQLEEMGNKEAKLTFTTNKGFRKKQNIRHPHAWSIADAKETVRWLLKY